MSAGLAAAIAAVTESVKKLTSSPEGLADFLCSASASVIILPFATSPMDAHLAVNAIARLDSAPGTVIKENLSRILRSLPTLHRTLNDPAARSTLLARLYALFAGSRLKGSALSFDGLFALELLTSKLPRTDFTTMCSQLDQTNDNEQSKSSQLVELLSDPAYSRFVAMTAAADPATMVAMAVASKLVCLRKVLIHGQLAPFTKSILAPVSRLVGARGALADTVKYLMDGTCEELAAPVYVPDALIAALLSGVLPGQLCDYGPMILLFNPDGAGAYAALMQEPTADIFASSCEADRVISLFYSTMGTLFEAFGYSGFKDFVETVRAHLAKLGGRNQLLKTYVVQMWDAGMRDARTSARINMDAVPLNSKFAASFSGPALTEAVSMFAAANTRLASTKQFAEIFSGLGTVLGLAAQQTPPASLAQPAAPPAQASQVTARKPPPAAPTAPSAARTSAAPSGRAKKARLDQPTGPPRFAGQLPDGAHFIEEITLDGVDGTRIGVYFFPSKAIMDNCDECYAPMIIRASLGNVPSPDADELKKQCCPFGSRPGHAGPDDQHHRAPSTRINELCTARFKPPPGGWSGAAPLKATAPPKKTAAASKQAAARPIFGRPRRN